MRYKNSLKTKNGLIINKVLSGRSNVYLITNGNENILIDTGIAFSRKRLLKRLGKLGAERIHYMVLTHSHFDHTGNARLIRDKFKPLTIIHKEETKFLQTGSFLYPDGTSFLPRLIIRTFARWFAGFIRFRPCTYDLAAEERFDFNFFGLNIYLLHTPGHTPGSVSVIVDDEIALVGDAMFGVFTGSIFPPYATDVSQMVKSWGKLLNTGCTLFLPSHGSANSRKLVEREYKKWSAKLFN